MQRCAMSLWPTLCGQRLAPSVHGNVVSPGGCGAIGYENVPLHPEGAKAAIRELVSQLIDGIRLSFSDDGTGGLTLVLQLGPSESAVSVEEPSGTFGILGHSGRTAAVAELGLRTLSGRDYR
jgi:hypothetical protein